MKLLSLTLKNFKGVKSFTFDPNGNDVSVLGDNGTGKSTLMDSVLWLLFGKDSQNKKDFEIKTLTPDGEPIHNLEHEVEGVFELNGKAISLKKIYKEKWTKKRGSTQAEFTGHTTDHYIDDVPVKAGEYADKIADICDEEAFKLLTSPTYFNTELHWEKRRDVLLEICGNVSMGDVVASNAALKELPEILGDRSIEQHKKVIASRRKKINDQLKTIPVRIDEVEQGLPDVTGLNAKTLAADLVEFEMKLEAKRAEISRIRNGGEVAEKTKQMRELESRLLDIQNKHRTKVDKQVAGKRQELQEYKDAVNTIQGHISKATRELEFNTGAIADLKEVTEKLRTQWHEANNSQFCFEQEDSCPTCGQDLPASQLEEARAKAQLAFNQQKAEKLESINSRGKKVKSDIEALAGKNKSLQEAIDGYKKELAAAEKLAENKQAAISEIIEFATDPTESPEYKKVQARIEKIDLEISDLQMGDRELLTMAQEDETAIKGQIQSVQDELRKFRDRKAGEERIQELTVEEKKLAAEFEKLEHELYLLDEYTKAEVALLEDKINSRFKHARFKLFKQNINGGVEPCCETLYNGVPYNSNLNTGHRIIVGLDIINTLSEHYNFSPMIFIDNAEGVTQLPEMSAQVVRLIKPEIRTEKDRKKYSKLVVNVHDGEAEEKTLFEEAV